MVKDRVPEPEIARERGRPEDDRQDQWPDAGLGHLTMVLIPEVPMSNAAPLRLVPMTEP